VTGEVWSFNTGDLVSWWKLDEGEGITVGDEAENEAVLKVLSAYLTS